MSSSRPVIGLAQNENHFSLTLALIEIAFGDLTLNLEEPPRLSESNQDEYVEYIKVKSIVDSHLLAKEMRSSYAGVVKRCFYFDFGIGEEDLSKKEVQEISYEKVVC